jgi:hypothetical protein
VLQYLLVFKLQRAVHAVLESSHETGPAILDVQIVRASHPGGVPERQTLAPVKALEGLPCLLGRSSKKRTQKRSQYEDRVGNVARLLRSVEDQFACLVLWLSQGGVEDSTDLMRHACGSKRSREDESSYLGVEYEYSHNAAARAWCWTRANVRSTAA